MTADLGDGLNAEITSLSDLLELALRRRLALLDDINGLRDDLVADPLRPGSRKYGPGYSLACRDITALLDQLLKEHQR